MTPRNLVIRGDALSALRRLAAGSVDCVITSPPYMRARVYDAGPGELGMEAHVDDWVRNLRAVTHEVHRVLAPHGSFWLNVGDSYSRHTKFGAPPKSLLLGPERLVRGLLGDGWIVRNRVSYQKTNPLPTPIADRLANTWEFVWHLVKGPSYFYDLDQIREPLTSTRKPSRMRITPSTVMGDLAGPRIGLVRMAAEGRSGHRLGKNPGDAWRLPPGRAIAVTMRRFPRRSFVGRSSPLRPSTSARTAGVPGTGQPPPSRCAATRRNDGRSCRAAATP